MEALPTVLRHREDRDVAIGLHSLADNTTSGIANDVRGWTKQAIDLALAAVLLDERNCGELSATGIDEFSYCCVVHSHVVLLNFH